VCLHYRALTCYITIFYNAGLRRRGLLLNKMCVVPKKSSLKVPCAITRPQCSSSSQSGLLLSAAESYSSSVGMLDQAGRPASACTGLYWQKGKINHGDTGSQPKHLHIRRDIKTTNMHLPVLDPMVFLNLF
jgi:hypothetical protein